MSANTYDVPTFSVIGQSNSIYTSGYCGRLQRKEGVKFVASGRLGASPSVIGPFFAADGALFESNYVIIDCCVIDLNGPTSSGWTVEDIRFWIEWIGHSARIRGCEPIFLLIPAATALVGPNQVLSIYEEVIRRHHYYYLDVRDLLNHVLDDPLTLYRDVAHPGDLISEQIADLLVYFMTTHRQKASAPIEVRANIKKFVRINLQDQGDQEQPEATYATSLFTFRGIKLEPGMIARVNTGACTKLHAVMINSYKSRGNLLIQGRERLTKGFTFLPYGTGGLCEARLVPIQSTVKDNCGFLNFAIAPVGAGLDEATAALKSLTAGEQLTIEISDLLIETRSVMHTYNAYVAVGSTNICDVAK